MFRNQRDEKGLLDLPDFLFKKILNELDANSIKSLQSASKNLNNLINSAFIIEQCLKYLLKLTNTKIRLASAADKDLLETNSIINNERSNCLNTLNNNGTLETNVLFKEAYFYYILESTQTAAVLAQIFYSNSIDYAELQLIGIEVTEEYQGRHLGMILMAHLFAYAQQHDIKNISLNIADSDDPELAKTTSNFYAKIGFKAFEEYEVLFSDKEWFAKTIEERMSLLKPGHECSFDMRSPQSLAMLKRELIKTILIYELLNLVMSPVGKKIIASSLEKSAAEGRPVSEKDFLCAPGVAVKFLQLLCNIPQKQQLRLFLDKKMNIDINLQDVESAFSKQIRRMDDRLFVSSHTKSNPKV